MRRVPGLLKEEKGFTLIELMVVVVIIGVLAAIAFPTINNQIDKAKGKRALAELKTMKTALDVYKAENGAYPTTGQIGEAFNDFGLDFGAINDPWNNAYVYSINSDTTPTAYKIVSSGPDGSLAAGDDDIMATNNQNPAENVSASAAVSLEQPVESGQSP